MKCSISNARFFSYLIFRFSVCNFVGVVMKYRCKIELAADMLSACMKAEKKTRIMNHSYVNFKQLYSYLNMLVFSGLLSFDSASDSYSITDQGKKFLTLYKIYKQHLLESEKKLAVLKEKRNELDQMCSPSNVQLGGT